MNKQRIRNDLILLVVVLTVAIALFFVFKSTLKTGDRAVVTVNGEQVLTLPLNDDTTKVIETEKGENVIQIRDGKARVVSADCPDKICVSHREISKSGETIICLPHKLVVEITEEG